MVSDSEVTSVLGAVTIGVADQRPLPMVMKIVPGNSDKITSMGDVKEPSKSINVSYRPKIRKSQENYPS